MHPLPATAPPPAAQHTPHTPNAQEPAEPLPLALRTATRDAHRALDHHPLLAGLLGPTVSAGQLAAGLRALWAAHAALEAWLAPHEGDWPGWQPEGWRHTPGLRQALAGLGVAPPAPMPWSLPHSPGHALGVWYVVLGAHLGGLAIARHLQRVAPHLPVAALAVNPAAVQTRWAGFTALATRLGEDSATRQQALHAARAAFGAIATHLNGATRPA